MNYTALMDRYEIETYVAENGSAPFEVWVQSLRDAKARLTIAARIERASIGDFGDRKSIKGAKGIFEMRIHYVQGFRVFYAVVGRRLILLLAGSTKQDQDRTIAKAKEYFSDYNGKAKS